MNAHAGRLSCNDEDFSPCLLKGGRAAGIPVEWVDPFQSQLRRRRGYAHSIFIYFRTF